jgi:myo-inositol-1(or 4)-monophosphatase
MSFDSVLEHGRGIDPDLGVAIEAANAAGKIIREGSGQMHDVELKGVVDLVSKVDQQADDAVTKILRQYSDLEILSEESSPEISEDVNEFWIVDPLDATSAFLTQAGPQYPSVLINRQKGSVTTSSVVYFPLTDEWFYAAKNRGAWHDTKRLVVDDSPMTLIESWVEMNQYADNSLETELFGSMRQRLRSKYGARLVTTNAPHSGVAVRIAQSKTALAVAIHDNSPSHVKQAAWDIAAPRLVLEEAGGVFMNFNGQPLDLFQAEPFIVARTKSLANEVISLFQTQMEQV